MAWTTPRDWTSGEVVTESHMDVHVRDNLTYLKNVLDGTQNQAITFNNVFEQKLGYAYLGAVNAASTYPRAAEGGIGDVAIGWNFLLKEVAFWNTDATSALSFDFRQLTGASTSTLLFRLMATGQIRGTYGSVSAPGYSFEGDDDTGVYRAGTDQVGLVAGSLLAWGGRTDGIICDVSATSISVGPSAVRQLRAYNSAGALMGYILIHPGA